MVHFIYSNTYYQIYVEHCDFYFKIHDTELIKSNFVVGNMVIYI